MPKPNADLRYRSSYVVIRSVYARECERVVVAEDQNVVALSHFMREGPVVHLIFWQFAALGAKEVTDVSYKVQSHESSAKTFCRVSSRSTGIIRMKLHSPRCHSRNIACQFAEAPSSGKLVCDLSNS